MSLAVESRFGGNYRISRSFEYGRIASLDGDGFAAVGSAMALKAVGKLTKADLQYVNQYRKAIGSKEFGTLKELRDYVLSLPDLVVAFEGPIADLLFDKRSKKEIEKVIEARKGGNGGK
ncbi:MAG: hypothetical protein IJS37_03100 [Bacilli bacterium]|nr:hypothetical protein [Bacilli bacterium]